MHHNAHKNCPYKVHCKPRAQVNPTLLTLGDFTGWLLYSNMPNKRQYTCLSSNPCLKTLFAVLQPLKYLNGWLLGSPSKLLALHYTLHVLLCVAVMQKCEYSYSAMMFYSFVVNLTWYFTASHKLTTWNAVWPLIWLYFIQMVGILPP